MVVDALSRKCEDEGSLFSLSFILATWLHVVFQERPQTFYPDPKISTGSSCFSKVLLA
jgi:hypothetical protein